MKVFKPSSIIFMIVAGAMIVAGILVCIVGGVMAKNQNIELFAESKDATGNTVSTRAFSGKTVNKITVNLQNANVNIIGESDKSGVEVINFSLNSFEYNIKDNEMTLKDAGIFSVFHINTSGGTFKGLRHYLAMPGFADKQKTVNIYLPKKKTDISKISVSIGSGNLTLENININTDYLLNTEQGDISILGVSSTGTCEIKITNGSLEFDENRIASTKANIEGVGGINCRINTQHSFTLETENGVIYLDSKNIGNKYSGVFPSIPVEDNTKAAEKTESEDKKDKDSSDSVNSEDKDSAAKSLPMVFYGKIKSGDMGIYLK